jgi:glycosyltransferase involved in cell wall biosynthesis
MRMPGRGVWRAAALELRGLVRRVRPDVVHSHAIMPAGYLAEGAGARPHVATAWGSEVLRAGPRQERFVARVCRGADLLTADSFHLLSAMAERGADEDALRFVPWGVDRAWLRAAEWRSRAQAAAELRLPTGRPIVLSHRGTAPVYEPQVVVRALARARRAVPDLLGVVKVDDRPGASDPRELGALARKLGAADAVRFEPKSPHAEMPLVYRAASVCVSVPSSDSAPTSVFEALALGVPAIVSELPWLEEPVYRHARLRRVPVGDHEALAVAIVDALRSPRPDDDAANRELVARELDRDRIFAGVETEYERLAAAR